ncbi:MAG TPA: HD domain-containing phosphohydrolase [Bradyrhizobium sp.]|nr:HD domain-containing phosphohydrolase [Bradyrhizobium sp.]
MSNDNGILLIADRPERSRELSELFGRICACRTVRLQEEKCPAGPFAVVVADVGYHRLRNIERLREQLAQSREAATPFVAILQIDSHLEEVQAAALGANFVVPAKASISEISNVLARIVHPAIAHDTGDFGLTGWQSNVEQARVKFGRLFHAARYGEVVSRRDVDDAAESILAAVADGGIRRWLRVVWAYDDATFQHCLLVTGVAAEFARVLRFALSDRKHLVRGALLHDVGKARIPLAILNKPDRLTHEERQIMCTHPRIGYELLRAQDDYEPELLEVVLSHHELLDGSGYPDGLVGPQISDLVRLVTICDIYAALIERRPYKQPMEPARAFAMLQQMGEKLESVLVREFARVAENSAIPVHA